jgi:hypothetical protein
MSLFITIMGAAGGHPTVMAEKTGHRCRDRRKSLIATPWANPTQKMAWSNSRRPENRPYCSMLGSIVDQLGGESSLLNLTRF